jgi:hypothetical protein
MRVISVEDIDEVQGGNSYVQWANTAMGGAVGASLGAARLGAALGTAAGPVGALIGGSVAFGATYLYFSLM